MSPGSSRPPDDARATSSDDAPTEVRDPGRTKSETQRGHDRGPEVSPAANPPLRVVSHKTTGLDSDKFARPLPEVKLRSVGEVRTQMPAHGMGNLAPPRDPKQARSRRVQAYLVWGAAVVIVASIVMLLVWFLAR